MYLCARGSEWVAVAYKLRGVALGDVRPQHLGELAESR
jgi:hypothetical protein